MAARRDTPCGARMRRALPDPEPVHVAPDAELSLSPVGRSFLDLLREDERYSDLLADPYRDENAA